MSIWKGLANAIIGYLAVLLIFGIIQFFTTEIFALAIQRLAYLGVAIYACAILGNIIRRYARNAFGSHLPDLSSIKRSLKSRSSYDD